MNHSGAVELDFGDETYSFRLTVTGAIELETKCDAPIAVIIGRVNQGAYKLNDLRETIRLGLIGGGMKPVEALKLVRSYVDERPLAESVPIARAILFGLMFGFAESPLAEAATEQPESPSASTPHTSTEQPPSSGSARKRSTASPTGNGALL